MKLLEEVKSSSSKWIKTKGNEFKNFYWQDGYGAFAIHDSSVGHVKNYILHQREHHQKKSFKEEFVELLKEFNIDYDERYVMD